MRYVCTSSGAVPRENCGAKAEVLAALTRTGLSVPPWIVVTVRACLDSLSPTDRAAYRRARSSATPFNPDADLWPGPDIMAAVHAALREHCPETQKFAVRSSAPDEDSRKHSFAGQLTSCLHVTSAGLPDAITEVWRSAFTERVQHYRHSHHLPLPGEPCAVIIQSMVDAEVSGVAFSADPISGRRSIAVVAAGTGTGEALVSGSIQGSVWRVDRSGGILENSPDQRTGAGDPLLLDDRTIADIAALARTAADHFGEPQDIEWALAGGSLYLLQSRPITTLTGSTDPDGLIRLWDNSNIIESYSGVTTPLTYSFARHVYAGVYRRFCQVMGVPNRVLRANQSIFPDMIGLIRGRIYYNLYNWYRLLALVPGFRCNRRFMEQMMGVGESLDPALAESIRTATRSGIRGDLFVVILTVVCLAWRFLTLPGRVRRFHRDIDAILQPGPIPPESMLPDELVHTYRQLEQQLLPRWDVPIINDLAVMILQGLLGYLGRVWQGESDICSSQLRCSDLPVSAEPVRRLRQLAQLAAPHPELCTALAAGLPAGLQPLLTIYPVFALAYEDYLTCFGDRCLEELKLESPTLRDNPALLMQAIARLAGESGVVSTDDPDVLKPPLIPPMTAAAGIQGFVQQLIFTAVKTLAGTRIRDRENMRMERTRVFGRVRRIFMELGKRLCAVDVINAVDDIFYLEVEEILGYINATTTTVSCKDLVALRRREFAGYRSQPAPAERFSTCGMVHHGNSFQPDKTSDVAISGELRTGMGCSPGNVRGRACVIRDPHRQTPQRGDIIVAAHTDPGWILIFPLAGGLVVERGSLLSHSAVVARELGLPAVVGLTGACTWLQDGDEIEIDGRSGSVRRLRRNLYRNVA